FLKQYYANQTILPKEILLEEPVDDGAAIEAYLSEAAAGFADTDKGNEGGADKGGGFLSSGHAVSQESGQGTENRPHTRVRLTIPERGKKHDLLLLAQKDVRESAELRAGLMAVRQEKDAAAIGQLLQIAGAAKDAGAAEPRIEAYDISHTGGADSVGAMVAFRGAEKSRRDYRRFKIRSEDGADDYGAIQEVLVRRFRRGLAGEKGFDELPDILLIDGGRGHVAAAEQALSALNVGIPVLGMVKDDKHRTRGLVARDNGDDTGAFSESDDARAFIETDLAGFPDLFHLIGTIQEEVHRFAVEYHRSLRGKRAVYSELNDISGIGEKRRAALLLKFGDIEGIRNASADELAAVPGMNQKSADQVFHHFRGED
ncbi:MAG: helix-hairpin-helix domain-containing protein, partial [Clostridiales bacterium]|nr:helix-hairpin-helix domain-containing protein [Clostridiales bacterium]